MLTSRGKGDFTHVIRVKAQAGERSLNYPGGINLITRVFKSRDPFPAVSEAAVTGKGRSGRCLTVGFEGGGRGP